MKKNKCKICRRLGQKLFLKGEKCFSPKCAMIKRAYPPGLGRKKRRRRREVSEYGKGLIEKQKLKSWYNLSETQFKNYIKKILTKKPFPFSAGQKVEDVEEALIKKIEKRLDNVIFRLGFTNSRFQARQLVSHCYFKVNGKPVNIPSFQVKKGDIITLKESKRQKTFFKNLLTYQKKSEIPSWLQLSENKTEGKVVGEPSYKESGAPAEILTIFEFYSK
ncbi:30S ribosomal protein S4 [bacterium (Candidatus Gribaldobacteria) CG07_land_8_20_14_0_80_33_18]|uniref:Small ribosomal subunit protein uS4 n=1 Tax=bacterium (Candidatus Gribaldobacteria) CG07_land_8_20_14_0_80_33_18 TaxID=2014272 RepID=A0A2M6Z3J4_9BACT|nr:MAG: 30S ribosomal protein S4 [bacterium (Candidatus Gribaldobacteria) CG07_land_8_20_14_0_80_33_18]